MKGYMKKQKRWILKLIVLLTITQLLQCPAVKYNNPTDGANGILMQLLDTIMATLAGVNTGSELRVVLIGNPSAITEGQSATVQMKLSKAIPSDLTVTLSLDNPIMKIDGADKKEFAFTPDNATVEQSFTLAALADGNTISETVNLKITGVGLTEQSFSISTIDNTSEIVQTVIFTGLPATITEGQTSIVQVKLAKEITSALTVFLTLDNSAITIDGVSFKILTFSPGNATTNQSFTLAAVIDTNRISETVNIKATATGLADQTLSISTIDNTAALPVITVSNSLTSIAEGQTGNVGIKLSGTVTENYIVSVTSGNTSAFTVSPSILIFTPANFSVDQTVTLTALQDANVVSELVTFALTSTGLSPVTFNVTSTDDDTLSLIVEKSLRILNGGSGLLSVRLSNQPASDMTVNFVSSNSSALTLSATSLTLTPSNYNQSQSITVNCTNQTPMQYTVTTSTTGITSQITKVSCLPTLSDSLLGLMRTGQTTSYATGDDGTHQATIARNYTDNGDGTVTDGIGLIWQKCSRGQNNDSSCSGFPPTTDWTTADAFCSGLSLASKTWRLPTVKELSSLVDASKSTIIDILAFPTTQLFSYWSSTPYTLLLNNAWSVTFSTFGSVSRGGKAASLHVRCVSGQPSSSPSFTDNANGTITDSATNLVWQKCSNGQNTTTCSGTASTFTWADAISYCNGLSLASKSWRLPNRNELQSILDYTKASSPALDAIVFPSTLSSNYWSSTNITSANAGAWFIDFTDGHVSTGNVVSGNKNNNYYVRCVSGP